MTISVWDTADTVDPSMLPVSPAIQDLLQSGAAARIEVEQWRAAFGESALKNAQNVLAERNRLRAQVAYYEGPQKQPGRINLVPAEQRAPLYAAYKAAREWAEKNGESYTDDGIIQAAVKAYRAELIAQAKIAAGVTE